MKLQEIKDWIDTLPKEFLEFDVNNAELVELEDSEYTARLDKPILMLAVDEENKEILFLNVSPKNEDLNKKYGITQ